jgi:Histidine kinase-like ATPase domain
MPAAPSIDGSGADRLVRVSPWDGASELSLARALQPPATACVEAGLPGALLGIGGLFHSLTLMVSTRAAFRVPVANAFIDGVDRRLHLADGLRVRMLTTLHEAVMNAVLHGNLGVGPRLRDDVEQVARRRRITEHRLAETNLGARMVFIEASWPADRIYLLVRDCGEGFARETAFGMPDLGGDGPRDGGRGLVTIEQLSDSVEYLGGGSAVRIGFTR